MSLWLNAGVHAPEVAERAGHSVDVLLKIYAKCIDGQREVANQRIRKRWGIMIHPMPAAESIRNDPVTERPTPYFQAGQRAFPGVEVLTLTQGQPLSMVA